MSKKTSLQLNSKPFLPWLGWLFLAFAVFAATTDLAALAQLEANKMRAVVQAPPGSASGSPPASNTGGANSPSSTGALSKPVPGSSSSTTSNHAAATGSVSLMNAATRTALQARYGQAIPQEFLLSNGLRVVILEEHAFPVVSCLMWYKVGSRNETAGVTGVSHLVEHLLFQNVGAFKKNELAATIVANGGQFNGFTSEDFTAFYSTLPPAKYEIALRGEAERMRGAKFSKADTQSEISNLVHEFDRDGRDFLGSLTREVHAASFEQHPYRNPPSGWRNDVEKLTFEDAKTFYDRYYHPDNAAIILVGDLKTAAALAAVKKNFGLIPKAPYAFPVVRATERAANVERRILMKMPVKKESLVVAYHAPSMSDPDAPAMTVLEKLLNGQLSGKLRKQLVDGKVCSSAQAVYELKKDPGLCTITMNALPGTTLPKVLEACEAMITQLRSQAPTDVELLRAKRQAEFEFFSEADGPYGAGFHLGFFEMLLNWQSAFNWPEKIRSVSAADIQRIANRYFQVDNRTVGFLASNAPPAPPKPSSPATTGWAPMRVEGVLASAISEDDERFEAKRLPIGRANYKESDAAPGPIFIAADQSSTPSASASVPSKVDDTTSSTTSPARAKTSSTTSGASGVLSPASALTKPLSILTTPVKNLLLQQPANKSAAAQNASAANSVPGVVSKTLKNGLNVIIVESHLNALVEVFGSVHAGSAFDPPDKRGMSALVCTLLNSGNLRATRAQLISEQEDLGLPPRAMIRFDGGLGNITFQSKFLSRDLTSQLNRLGSCLREPRFNDADIEKAKQDLVNVVAQGDDTRTRVQRTLLRDLVPATSRFYPADPSEKAKSIANLKVADIKDFHSNYVAPNGTSLVIAGDVSAAQIIPLLEHSFDGWNSKRNEVKMPLLAGDGQANTKHASKTSIPMTDKIQSLVCLGRIVPIMGGESEDKLWSHLLISDCALTNHPIFSRINRTLDAEPDSIWSGDFLKSHIQPFPDASIWALFIPVESSTASSAVDSIQNELKKFTKNGLTAEELIEAKRYLLGSIPVAQMSNLDAVCRATMESFEERDELSPLAKTAAAIRGATLDSVNRFILTNFKPDQAAVVVAGNKQVIHQVKPAQF